MTKLEMQYEITRRMTEDNTITRQEAIARIEYKRIYGVEYKVAK